MSKPNRGKDFESKIRAGLDKCKATAYLRLFDSMSGYKGVANPCDFIAYKFPNIFFFECKCCYGNFLNFANISAYQWRSLVEFSKTPGVIAGYIIWFIDHDTTIFVDAPAVDEWMKQDKKSIHIKDVNDRSIVTTTVEGKKHRVFFDYDMNKLLNALQLKYTGYRE